MKTFGIVVGSLVVSAVLHFTGGLLGGLITFVVVGKSQSDAIWLFGYCYAPFFVCGMILAATRGFPFPRLLAPSGALAAACLFVAATFRSDLEFPQRALIFGAVPFSLLGCVAVQALKSKRLRPAAGQSDASL